MKKKVLGGLVASALVCAIGAVTGLVMIFKSGKIIDEHNGEREKKKNAYSDNKRN